VLAGALLTSCGESEPTTPFDREALLAKGGESTPTVDATSPASAPQDTTLDVRVFGSAFDNGSTASFLLNGKPTPKVRTNGTSFISPTELVANITIAADAVVDLYDVQVTTTGGKKGVGIELFAVRLKGNPSDPPFALSLTMGQGSSGTDAIRSDDVANSPYVEEDGGTVGAHFSPNVGTLMLWTSQYGTPAARLVRVATTAVDGFTDDRIFSRSHNNPGGDNSRGFLGMVNGSVGDAVFVAELNLDPNDLYEAVYWGQDCSGVVIPSQKVVTTRSADGNTWTATGTTGVHCKRLRKRDKVLTQIGTAGPFSMTMVHNP
jgi:hypothetical protein